MQKRLNLKDREINVRRAEVLDSREKVCSLEKEVLKVLEERGEKEGRLEKVREEYRKRLQGMEKERKVLEKIQGEEKAMRNSLLLLQKREKGKEGKK